MAGVIGAVDFGGIHLESLSHLSFFLAGLVGDFGGLIHLDVSVVLGESDGHCHDDGGGGGGAGTLQFGSFADLGVGVGVGVSSLHWWFFLYSVLFSVQMNLLL